MSAHLPCPACKTGLLPEPFMVVCDACFEQAQAVRAVTHEANLASRLASAGIRHVRISEQYKKGGPVSSDQFKKGGPF